MNSPVQRFNPETIIIREGESSKFVNVGLTGNVEMIQSDKEIHLSLSSGTLLGEETALHDLPSARTFRASNFVWCLRIPRALYLAFVTNNNLLDEISQLRKRREFLQKISLFEEAISYGVLNNVVATTELHSYEPGSSVDGLPPGGLTIVGKGRVVLDDGKGKRVTHKTGDFFGEETLFGETPDYSLHFEEETRLLCLPYSIIGEIPIVRWKLFEYMKGRAF